MQFKNVTYFPLLKSQISKKSESNNNRLHEFRKVEPNQATHNDQER